MCSFKCDTVFKPLLLPNPTLTPRPPRFVRCALLLVLTPQGFHKRAHLTKVGVEAWHHAVFASTRPPEEGQIVQTLQRGPHLNTKVVPWNPL